MSLRGPSRRAGRVGTAAVVARLAVIVGAAVLAGAIAAPVSRAQPALDLSLARDLYNSAEAAMSEGRFDDAARDYGASYQASKDPALFFKIGHAHERAGRCDVALSYYARYLREGHPTEQFIATTRERILACGGDVRSLEGGSAAAEPRPTGSGGAQQAAGSASGAPGSDATPAAAGSAEAAGSPAPAPLVLVPSNSHKVAWIMTGSAVALATLGGVLAYAASSSENDIRDLYVGFAGQPVTFDAETSKKYDALVADGHRYQHLSWASFGLAGAAAAGAAILFVIGGSAEPPIHARATPIVTTTGAGVAVTF